MALCPGKLPSILTLALVASAALAATACSSKSSGSSDGSNDAGAGDDGSGVVVPDDAGGCIGADAGVLALTSDNKPISFIVAAEDPASGDWLGQGGYVAQVFFNGGGWAANLLDGFETPNASPAAVLTGTPVSCTEMSFTGSGWTASLKDGHFTGQNGSQSIDLTHVLRIPSTMGSQPPAGGVLLFDGTSFDQWSQKSGSNWLTPAGPPQWKLVDGAMEVVPGTDSLISNLTFGDCHVHAEFRTVGTPTHSGVFLEARYQVTVLESYGAYGGNITGDLGNESPVVNPTIHAERAALEWQALDIDFQAPRFDAGGNKTANAVITVRLNDALLFDHAPLNKPSGAAGKFPEAATGPILLEYHGMPVQYRNIWVLPASQM
jgi:hypothetical protein